MRGCTSKCVPSPERDLSIATRSRPLCLRHRLARHHHNNAIACGKGETGRGGGEGRGVRRHDTRRRGGKGGEEWDGARTSEEHLRDHAVPVDRLALLAPGGDLSPQLMDLLQDPAGRNGGGELGESGWLPRPKKVPARVPFLTHMLQCRSNARTRPSSLWLLRRLMRTFDPFFTLRMRMESGPLESCCCSVSSTDADAPAPLSTSILFPTQRRGVRAARARGRAAGTCVTSGWRCVIGGWRAAREREREV